MSTDQPTAQPVPDQPVTVYFSFGHGQTDPTTGENLLDKYVTITGPSWEACREAMFASRYGDRWAFDYPAGAPDTEKWLPRWTEHDRLSVDPMQWAALQEMRAADELETAALVGEEPGEPEPTSPIIRVTALDLELGDVGVCELRPGQFVVTCAEPLYVHSENRDENTGEIILVLKRRKGGAR